MRYLGKHQLLYFYTQVVHNDQQRIKSLLIIIALKSLIFKWILEYQTYLTACHCKIVIGI